MGEVHSIAKSITLKEGLADAQLTSHSDAGKVIRKVNVKMGIRIVDGNKDSVPADTPFHDEKRICMTAILFGI